MTTTLAETPPADEIRFERRGAVALLTLNRPQALNSFTRSKIGRAHV